MGITIAKAEILMELKNTKKDVGNMNLLSNKSKKIISCKRESSIENKSKK